MVLDKTKKKKKKSRTKTVKQFEKSENYPMTMIKVFLKYSK